MLKSGVKTQLILFCSICTSTGLLGLIATFLEIIFISRDKKQRNSVFGIILISLSIADFLVSIAQIYRGIIDFLTLTVVIDYELYSVLNAYSNVATVFSIASSFCHVIYIAAIRVLALALPLKIKQIITKSRSKVILLCLWLLSIGFSLVAYSTLGNLLCASLAIVSTFILFLAYSIICWKLYKQHGIQGNESTQRNRQESDKDVLLYSITLTLIFSLCYLPGSIFHFIKMPLFMMYVGVFCMPSTRPLIPYCISLQATARKEGKGGT